MTNRKTVEHHVSTALRKRGVQSRTELAVAFAAGIDRAPEARDDVAPRTVRR